MTIEKAEIARLSTYNDSKDWHIATSAIRAALACRRKVEVEVDLKKDGTGTMVFRAFWQKPGTHKPKTEAAPKPE
jgi:hypothetical protein